MGEPLANPLGEVLDISQFPTPQAHLDTVLTQLSAALADGPNFVGFPCLFSIVDPQMRPEVVTAAVRLACLYNREEQLVDWAISEGLEQTEADETIFREGDLFSIILREYFRHKGQALSKRLFSGAVQRIAEHQYHLDVSRTPIVDGKTRSRYASDEERARVRASAAEIRNHTKEVCSIICDSVEEFATALGPIIPLMKRRVEQRFPAKPELFDHSVRGLFFLRYICSGLTNALEWGLLRVQDKRKASRLSKKDRLIYEPYVFSNIASVAKIVQKIANNAEFDQWENFSIFNKSVNKATKRINNFIDAMIAETPAWPYEGAFVVGSDTSDLRIIADYIAKSGPDKGPEFKRAIIAIAKKRTKRAPPGELGYDKMAIGGVYMNMNSLFVGKDVIRAYLSSSSKGRRERMHKKLSKHESVGAKLLTAAMRKFEPVRKEDFDGQDYYKYDAEATLDTLLEGKEFAVLVFYRGQWCPFCRENLNEWCSQAEAIVAQKGVLVGISSQNHEFCQQTAEEWGLNFPLVGDPENVLANRFGVEVTVVIPGKNEDAGNGFYPFGMSQAAVIAIDQAGQFLSYWASVPGPDNDDGANARPKPGIFVRQLERIRFHLKRSDSAEFSLDTSAEYSDVDSWEDAEQEDEELLSKVLLRSSEDTEFAEALIRALGTTKQHRDLFHRVRAEARTQK